MQYSKQQLFSYLNSKYYKEDDYIIFVTTSYTMIRYKPRMDANTYIMADDKEAMTKQKKGALAETEKWIHITCLDVIKKILNGSQILY